MNKKEKKGAEENIDKDKKKKAEPVVYNFPPIDYDALKKVPTFNLEIRYAGSKVTDNTMIEIILPIDSTLTEVIHIIEEKHNNSLKNVNLFLGKDDAANKT
jgi:hypothetical protein